MQRACADFVSRARVAFTLAGARDPELRVSRIDRDRPGPHAFCTFESVKRDAEVEPLVGPCLARFEQALIGSLVERKGDQAAHGRVETRTRVGLQIGKLSFDPMHETSVI